MVFRLVRVVVLSAAILMPVSGCAGRTVIESDGGGQWSGVGNSATGPLPVSLTLPAGSWEIEEVTPGSVILFRRLDGSGRIAIMRLAARPDEPASLALMRLFAHFKDKTILSRSSRPVKSGVTGQFAEYAVVTDERTLHVFACVFRHGDSTYDLVAWDMGSDTFDAVADSVAFVETADQ